MCCRSLPRLHPGSLTLVVAAQHCVEVQPEAIACAPLVEAFHPFILSSLCDELVFGIHIHIVPQSLVVRVDAHLGELYSGEEFDVFVRG